MIKFEVRGEKTIGDSKYSFYQPNLAKEKAVEFAIDKENHGFNCTIKAMD